jgi:hypothetical protein
MCFSGEKGHKRLMGLRGSTMFMVYPDIFVMQIRATARAILDALSQGIHLKGTQPEVGAMVSAAGDAEDLRAAGCVRSGSRAAECLQWRENASRTT